MHGAALGAAEGSGPDPRPDRPAPSLRGQRGCCRAGRSCSWAARGALRSPLSRPAPPRVPFASAARTAQPTPAPSRFRPLPTHPGGRRPLSSHSRLPAATLGAAPPRACAPPPGGTGTVVRPRAGPGSGTAGALRSLKAGGSRAGGPVRVRLRRRNVLRGMNRRMASAEAEAYFQLAEGEGTAANAKRRRADPDRGGSAAELR